MATLLTIEGVGTTRVPDDGGRPRRPARRVVMSILVGALCLAPLVTGLAAMSTEAQYGGGVHGHGHTQRIASPPRDLVDGG